MVLLRECNLVGGEKRSNAIPVDTLLLDNCSLSNSALKQMPWPLPVRLRLFYGSHHL